MTNKYEFSSSSMFLSATEHSISRFNIATGTVNNILAKVRSNSWPSNVSLFNSICRSTLLFSVQIWGLRYLDRLEYAQTNFYKHLFHLLKSTPYYIILLETGIPHMASIVFKLALKWFVKYSKWIDPDYQDLL